MPNVKRPILSNFEVRCYFLSSLNLNNYRKYIHDVWYYLGGNDIRYNDKIVLVFLLR